MKERLNPNLRQIFISHASEDQKDAVSLKKWLENSYTGIKVFLSSANGIQCGENPSIALKGAMLKADILITLLTPESMNKPWILFETGAVCGRRKKVLPLLCKGATNISEVPGPITLMFQVKIASNKDEFQDFINELSKEIGQQNSQDTSSIQKQLAAKRKKTNNDRKNNKTNHGLEQDDLDEQPRPEPNMQQLHSNPNSLICFRAGFPVHLDTIKGLFKCPSCQNDMTTYYPDNDKTLFVCCSDKKHMYATSGRLFANPFNPDKKYNVLDANKDWNQILFQMAQDPETIQSFKNAQTGQSRKLSPEEISQQYANIKKRAMARISKSSPNPSVARCKQEARQQAIAMMEEMTKNFNNLPTTERRGR